MASYLCGLAAATSASAVSHYSVVDLGTLSGPVSDASTINNAGVVGGSSWINGAGLSRAFITLPNPTGPGQLVSLGLPFGDPNVGIPNVAGISDDGHVVGVANGHSFLIPPNPSDPGQIVDLGTSFEPSAINGAGRVVGSASGAVISAPNPTGPDQFVNLGTLQSPGAPEANFGSVANDINSSGRVVGLSGYLPAGAGSPGTRAFITGPNPTGAGQLIDLGTLVGDDGTSDATALNDVGQVVGRSTSTSGTGHAFISTPNPTGPGQLIDIGSPGKADSSASDINASGVVVGSFSTDVAIHAFVSDPSPNGPGHLYDLNTLLVTNASGFELVEANAINDRGQIVGFGFVNGHQHGFLLNPVPVPLPPAGVLALGGLIALAWHSAKRRG